MDEFWRGLRQDLKENRLFILRHVMTRGGIQNKDLGGDDILRHSSSSLHR